MSLAHAGRGGRLRSFFWPRPIRLGRELREHGAYARARDAVWNFVRGLRLPYFFWLGLRGFIGGFVYLIVPITLLAAGSRAPVLGILGGLLLAAVVLYLPFAQVRFAVENRWSAMFELRAIRDQFRRAPVAFCIALAATLLFALPLYLLKVEIIPREAAWLPSLIFVAFIFPARLLVGWAYARASRRAAPRHWISRWAARLAMGAAAIVYAVIVYFTQFTSWYGIASLYEQHAFLLPVPFWGYSEGGRRRLAICFAPQALQESLHAHDMAHVLAAADQLLLVVGFDGERHARAINGQYLGTTGHHRAGGRGGQVLELEADTYGTAHPRPNAATAH